MTSAFDDLRRMGDRVSVPISKDDKGFLGRECPEPTCEGYFKIKPGTGLPGEGLPCTCPYCGHQGPTNTFWTKEQVAYAKSVALRQITEAVRRDLKKLEFEHKPKGAFGIGISMKLKPGAPVPIRYYREQALETKVTCDQCSLEYSVFGVFGFCPDCAIHNSLQILQKNLALTRKQFSLAASLPDTELRSHLIEDALENCVSAFDAFARETCRVRAAKSSDATKCANLSFQNLERGAKRIRELFGPDISASVPPDDWTAAQRSFMRRHLLAHKAGVIDHQYLAETGEPSALLGRRITIAEGEAEKLADTVESIARAMVSLLPSPK